MSQDFEELLASFNAAKVRYLIAGAHALALHARPRATKDLDLVVDPTRANAKRIVKALAVFFGGVAPRYASEDAFMDQSTIVQLGVAPIRVDIISAFGTLTFARAWKQRVEARFGSVPAHFLCREHLLAEKRHFNRPQDRADIAALLMRHPPEAKRPGRTSESIPKAIVRRNKKPR